jgi:uncharacterized protein
MSSSVQRYGKWAVVTGAGSGIGRAFARRLAEGGFDLVLVARDARRLDAVAAQIRDRSGVEVRTLPLDLAQPHAAEVLAAKIEMLDAGMLVHAAGARTTGNFLDASLASELAILELNVAATTALCHVFGRRFRERGAGALLLIASSLAFQGAPFLANYNASKAHNLMLGEALRDELRGSGVDVLVVAPGPTRTDATIHDDYAALGVAPMDPAVVAARSLAVLGRVAVFTPGVADRVLAFASRRILPRTAAVRLVGAMMRRIFRRALSAAPSPADAYARLAAGIMGR